MAKIPMLSGSPRLRQSDPLAPTLSAREAGAPFKQKAALADQVAGGMFQLQKKQQAEADKVSYTKANIGLSESFNEVSSQMEKEYREGKPNHEGYADDAMERMEVHKTFILEQTPESAKGQVSLAFDQKMSQMKGRVQSFESGKKSEYAFNETKGMVQDASNGTYSHYSPLDTLETSRRLQGLVATSSQFDQKSKQVLLKQMADLPKDMLDGVLDREDPSEMRRALHDIDSEDMEPVFGSMDPVAVTKAKAKLKRKLEYKSSEGKKELNTKYNNLMAAYKGGTLKGPEARKISNDVKNELTMRLGQEKAGPMIDQIETQEAISSHANDAPFESWDTDAVSKEIAGSNKDPLTRAASQARVKSSLDQKKLAMQNEFKKDPASYIMKHDQGIALNAQAMMGTNNMKEANEAFSSMMIGLSSRYDQMGTPVTQRKYVPDALKAHYGGALNQFISQGNHKEAAGLMNDFVARTGDNSFRFYDELGLPDKYAAVTEVGTPEGRTRVMRNLMNEKEDINPRYEGIQGKQSDPTIQAFLRNDPMYKAIMSEDGGLNTSSGVRAESMLKVAQVEYKLAKLNGDDDDTAKDRAWSSMSDSYDIIPNAGGHIPIKKGKHSSENAKLFLDNNTKANIDYMNKFGLKLHEGSSMEATNEQFRKNSRWTYNRKSDSMVLGVYDPSQARWARAEKKDGGLVSVKLSDIDIMDDLKPSDSALDARRNIMSMSRMGIIDKPKEKPTMKFEVQSFKKHGNN